MGDLIWLGIILITIGCLSSAVGMLFMKWSMDVEADLQLCRRRRWALGFFFLVVNATVIDIIAFGITPLSMIAPFAGLTIVFTSLLASTGWLHVRERLSPTAIGCTALVLVGVTLVSIFGPHPRDELPLVRMQANFVHPQFLGFAAVTITSVGTWLLVSTLPPCAGCRPRSDGMLTTFLSAWSAAVCGALSQLFLKIVAVALKVRVERSGHGSGSPWSGLGLTHFQS